MEKQPTWADMTSLQFRLERELVEAKQDRDKYKYALRNYRDVTIDRLEAKVKDLEAHIQDLEERSFDLEKSLERLK